MPREMERSKFLQHYAMIPSSHTATRKAIDLKHATVAGV